MARPSKKQKDSKLLMLSSLAFLLVSSCALSLSKVQEPAKEVVVYEKQSLPLLRFAPLPVLASETASPVPEFTASSVIAIDIHSGVLLYEKNADEKLFPASTTKIVTALVVLDSYHLDDVVTIGNLNVVGQKMGLLEGEQITVRDLLSGMLIYSANDAAEALASHYVGGRQAFVSAMNAKAAELHLTNTHFANPSGLEDFTHVSTARDMARVAQAAMENPIFAEIVSTPKATVYSVDKSKVHKLTNINKLIGSVDGVLGVKTGWTEHAKENLVTYVERDGKGVVISLLGSDDRFGETEKLIDWVYASYEWQSVSLP